MGASTDESLLVSSDTETHGSDVQESDNQVIASSCFSDQREPVLACPVSDDSPCDRDTVASRGMQAVCMTPPIQAKEDSHVLDPVQATQKSAMSSECLVLSDGSEFCKEKTFKIGRFSVVLWLPVFGPTAVTSCDQVNSPATLRTINDALTVKNFSKTHKKTFKDLPTPKRKNSRKIKRIPKHKPMALNPQGSPACSVAKQRGIEAFLVKQACGPMGDGAVQSSTM